MKILKYYIFLNLLVVGFYEEEIDLVVFGYLWYCLVI